MANKLLILFCFLMTIFSSKAFAEPREILIENALLQQLHSVIVSSLKDIYKEKYPQFGCSRITLINERVTVKRKDKKASPVDAMHGATFFEITVVICRPNKDNVELILKNDTATAQYYLLSYKIFSSK
ncbi:hypothetical protein SAMN05443246_2164 [Paenibacillus sp. GP183]|nr:hypothetical protein SAMN05443246_2164 [Paenibacillus sp. GP183]